LLPVFAHAGANPVLIRFRYWGDFEEIRVIQATVKAFEHDHPGVIVHAEREPSGDEYLQKLLLEKAAGLTPDVIFCANNFGTMIGKGMLRDLSPFISHDHSFSMSRYDPQVVKVFARSGEIYALPRDIAPEGLVYYNKTLFDNAHIPYPDGTWSWDYVPHPERGNKDFLNVAERLTQRGLGGEVKVYGCAYFAPGAMLDNLVYSSGADYVDNDLNPTKLLYNDPRVVKAIQLTEDTMYKYNVSPSTVDQLSAGVGPHEMFDQGKVAMYVCGIWEVPQFRDEITSFDWDIAPFPAGPTGLHGVASGWSGYAMSKTTQYPEQSWELLKYLAGPPGLSRLASAGLAQPAISGIASSKLWLDGKRPVNRVVTVEEVPYVHMGVLYPDWNQISNLVTPKLQLVWSGTISAQQAVNEFFGPAQAKLDELNHPAFHPNLNWYLAFLAVIFISLLIVGWVWQGALIDKKSGRRIGSRAEARAGYLFISPWIIGAVVFLTVPMLISLVLVFCDWDMITDATWVGLGNFSAMLQDEQFWKSLSVTGIYTLFSVPLGVGGSLLLALLLHTKIRGQGVFRTLYYIPAVASTVAASLIWMRLFNPESGMINYVIGVFHLTPVFAALKLTDPTKGYIDWLGSEKTALASLIIMSLWGIGGGMVIFLAGLQGIPQSYYEAAEIDGANVYQKFTNVTLPLLSPTIFFNLIIGVIGSFQTFTQGFVMTQGGPNNATLFYVLYLYENAFQFLKIGYASALAWVLFMIILIITIIQMKSSSWVHYEAPETK